MQKMIRGCRADYSASLYELKGASIVYRENGAFIDLLRDFYPDDIAQKILHFHLKKKLNKGA